MIGLNSGAKPEITDFVLMADPYGNAGATHSRLLVKFRRARRIHNDLWIGPVNRNLTKAIMKACMLRGENFRPVLQFWCPYGFIRKYAPTDSNNLQFDPDRILQQCVALSRLVHPTSIGYQFAARVIKRPGSRRKIVPFDPYTFNKRASVIDVNENWLNPDDILLLRKLITCFEKLKDRLSNRIKTAMWYYEYLSKTHFMDIRWTLLITALESLIKIADEKNSNTKKYVGSTKVFVDRLTALARFDSSLSVTRGDLGKIYNERSNLVHGLGVASLDPVKRALYRKAETLIRNILQKAILDATFASIFDSDASIKRNLPLRP